MEELITQCVSFARSETEIQMKTALEEYLLSLRKEEENDPLDRTGLWNKLYEYVKEMRNDPDESKKRRGYELNGLMGEITKNAKKILNK